MLTNTEIQSLIDSSPKELYNIFCRQQEKYLEPKVVDRVTHKSDKDFYYAVYLQYDWYIYVKNITFVYHYDEDAMEIMWVLPNTLHDFFHSPIKRMWIESMDKIRDYFRILGFRVYDSQQYIVQR